MESGNNAPNLKEFPYQFSVASFIIRTWTTLWANHWNKIIPRSIPFLIHVVCFMLFSLSTVQSHQEYITSARAATCKSRREHRYELNARHQVIITFVCSSKLYGSIYPTKILIGFVICAFISFSRLIFLCQSIHFLSFYFDVNRKPKPKYNLDQKVWKPSKWWVQMFNIYEYNQKYTATGFYQLEPCFQTITIFSLGRIFNFFSIRYVNR